MTALDALGRLADQVLNTTDDPDGRIRAVADIELVRGHLTMRDHANTPTIHLEIEGRFKDYTTRGLVEYLVELLREGDVITGDGDQDYALADMLEIFGTMHDQTGISLEGLPQVRAYAIVLLDQAGWSE